jgi:hypothetical protein
LEKHFSETHFFAENKYFEEMFGQVVFNFRITDFSVQEGNPPAMYKRNRHHLPWIESILLQGYTY